MRPNIGGNLKMYRNTGTAGTPVWVLVASVENVAISDLSRGAAEMKIRSSQFVKSLPALVNPITIEFKHWYGIDSTNFAAMQSMFWSGATEEWALMDDLITTTGSQGLRCACFIEKFNRNEEIDNAVNMDVGLRHSYWESPAGTVIDPSWYTVSGGSTTTTTSPP